MPDELVFEVTQEDGGYSAHAFGQSMVTQGDSWVQLRAMVLHAVKCHFGEGLAPRHMRLHLLGDEVLPAA